MKNFQKFLLVAFLAIVTLNLNAQVAGGAYPIVERATFDNTPPCSVCTPWQFVQADSTLRRWSGAWYTYYDPGTSGADGSETLVTAGTNVTVTGTGIIGDPYVINSSGGGTDLSVSVTSVNATVVSSTGTNATIPAAQISAAGVMSAADKVKLDGLAGYSTQTITSGNLTVIVDRYGTDPVTFTVNATGDYTLVIPATTRVDNIFIHGDNTTLSSGSFIFRIDNNANSSYERMITQLYNTASGGLVDVFSQGNNHTRGVSSNIVSDTFPNMSPYGGTGFDILYR